MARQEKDAVPQGFQAIEESPSNIYDPVIRQWNMYMNVNPDVHVMLLRYPERLPGQLYNAKSKQKPLEMRIKPNFMLVEVDIPIDPYDASYDQVRGIIYGEALRKSEVLKEKGGSYGVAGGFGLGGSSKNRALASFSRGFGDDNLDIDSVLADYDNAVKDGLVMNKITLGGHINPWTENNPNFFVGAFRDGKNCILHIARSIRDMLTITDKVFFTKVDAICVLRPQLVHLDALNDLKKSTLRMQPGADTEANEASHVNLTIKKTEGESMESGGETGEIAKLLKAMRAEQWQRLSWIDSEVILTNPSLSTQSLITFRHNSHTTCSNKPLLGTWKLRVPCPNWLATLVTRCGSMSSAALVLIL